jgi:hypothetical protein
MSAGHRFPMPVKPPPRWSRWQQHNQPLRLINPRRSHPLQHPKRGQQLNLPRPIQLNLLRLRPRSFRPGGHCVTSTVHIPGAAGFMWITTRTNCATVGNISGKESRWSLVDSPFPCYAGITWVVAQHAVPPTFPASLPDKMGAISWSAFKVHQVYIDHKGDQ